MTRRPSGPYSPAATAAIAKADRVYMRCWLDARHGFERTADLRLAMDTFNQAAGRAEAAWKQSVREAIEQDYTF